MLIPRKDQRDHGVKHKVCAISDADHTDHLVLKNSAHKRKEKTKRVCNRIQVLQNGKKMCKQARN